MSTFSILYNICYGGLSFSEFAIEKLAEMGVHGYGPYDRKLRTNKNMIDIFNEYGSKLVSGSCAHIDIITLDQKYENYYNIEEYDGIENIVVEYDKFELDQKNERDSQIVKILKSDKSNEQKIEEITKLMED